MYILDTDHLSLIQRNSPEGKRILARLEQVDAAQVAVTVVTYEEQIRGQLSIVSSAKTVDAQVAAYAGLLKLALDYQSIQILPFSHAAALKYQDLRKTYPRLGKMDLRIAAIALTDSATLLTCNASDFGQIEVLRVENWTTL